MYKRQALDRIAQMTLDEIDAMARDIGISAISIRLTETEMDRLLSLQGLQKAAYSISIAAVSYTHLDVYKRQVSRHRIDLIQSHLGDAVQSGPG